MEFSFRMHHLPSTFSLISSRMYDNSSLQFVAFLNVYSSANVLFVMRSEMQQVYGSIVSYTTHLNPDKYMEEYGYGSGFR